MSFIYIIRWIESDKTISKASDKVFGRKKRQQEDLERKQILKNQKTIMEMQKQILDRLGTKEWLLLYVLNRVSWLILSGYPVFITKAIIN